MSNKRILLTGSSGFVGQHLKRILKKNNHNVSDPNFDLLSFDEIKIIANQSDWDVVVHLAGLSTNAQVINDPTNAFDINVRGAYLLANEIFLNSPKAHFIFPSTGYVYSSSHANNSPFLESSELHPTNAYSATKLYAENLLKTLSHYQDKKITVLRLFNHSHKTQAGSFFLAYVYNQFLPFAGTDKVVNLPIGNTEVERDFGCVQDLMSAFEYVVDLDPSKSKNFEIFNVSTGKAYVLKSLIAEMAKQMNVKYELQVSPDRIRAGEPKYLSGNSMKLQELTGWKPHVNSPESLIKSFLEDFQ